ncbi:MAG: dUTP diphosphatase [Vulcanibacillus sp.]
MSLFQIKLKRLSGSEDIPLPERMSSGSSGYDIYAGVTQDIIVPIGKRALVPTGFSLELPQGIEAQIRPRSGLALKHGVTLLNTPGTIDADYRGEVKIIIINLGEEDFIIKRYDRIAQLVFVEIPSVSLNETNEISETNRGIGGFGHTGLNLKEH